MKIQTTKKQNNFFNYIKSTIKQKQTMLNHYETVFILTPVLSEEKAKEAVSKYKKMLTDNGCTITSEDHWGLRKLQYPIKKRTTGFYQVFEFQAPPQYIAELELTYKRDEKILRYLTVSLDKHAVAYSERKRNKTKEVATN